MENINISGNMLDDVKNKIKSNYGESFLDKLENLDSI